ncbi:uncharacterized protein SPPG_05943 [Spizellomyces punctatus DAOM BR117]|uniref:UspA domain-containing protein n=1 Tax=Spizellomyces punctatus (strain DAOM BR117) TaxID=645134 RepID=A0A0L0HCV6_SPIPD|nr:uncharacterized protein SPPG_05943 [Spizellomyces punctatus DAOM BR117]KNC98992.1 hypothetical protein SPPG_05943 [Spizellomyces punctatus DAOM BR117]|eukprot:XP_016607032.1 hypothetical protein SPPG_05943 [Spizellomyces punctatus DAOM BR117]
MADTLSLQESIANPTAYPVTDLGQTMYSNAEPLLRTRTGETSGPPSAQTPTFSPLSGGRHLLVGVDDSEYSIEALKFAFTGYAKEGDRMTVVKAISPLPGQFGPNLPGDYRRDKMIELYEEVGKIRIEVGAERIPYRVDIRYGDPREILIEASKQIHPTCIIVGSRGRSGLTSMFLGSVSLYVLQNADYPVLIVKKGAFSTLIKPPPGRRASAVF